MKLRKIKFFKLKHLKYTLRVSFWFLIGALLSVFFVTTSIYLIFQKINNNRIYPGIIVNGINLGGKDKEKTKQFYLQKNEEIKNTTITFLNNKNPVATISAKDIELGYDDNLISTQAYSIGRSENILTDIYLISKAYVSGIYLPPTYKYSESKLNKALETFARDYEKKPVDALFKFENGKVTAFQASEQGRAIDREKLDKELRKQASKILSLKLEKAEFEIPTEILESQVSTQDSNKFGIKELIASGSSHFARSIPQRIHNISLATSRVNGALVAPGQTFSFNAILGDVTIFTGYQQAYVIRGGKTVLGDGGGVCQVSTTLFRAILNSGLPVVERNQHSYRVGYYEQDSLPGLDATIYVPSVDLKFKNDTKHHILIQSAINYNEQKLEFSLYGTKDEREVFIGKPVISNQTSPPPPLFTDDPTLPKGEVKQIDFEASGAKVTFTRTVSKDGATILSDKFISNFQPWQAVYLRGTRE